MRKTIFPLFIVFAFVYVTAFMSCRRDQDDHEIQTSVDNSIANSEFSSIQNMFDIEGRNDSTISGKTGGVMGGYYCPGSVITVTVIDSLTANLEIDFGTGCTCADARTRTGKLTGVFHGKWTVAGSFVTITPTNYTVNSMAVDFNKTITYNGLNPQSHPNWDISVTDASIVTPTGTILWESERNHEWIAGILDANILNNEYLITGTASGTSRNGINFDMNIDEALHIKLNCAWVAGGVLSVTPEGRDARTIDYGDGTCDNQAVFSVGNYTTTITLP